MGRSFLRSRRVLLEDALKHAYMCERQGLTCTLESVAGRLEVSTARAAELLAGLGQAGLVELTGRSPELTGDGRQAALQLLRSHRLLERYLADRTGLPAGEWHEVAERMEHSLTAEETNALASRLGHPAWDPHGDPIPTSRGELPPVRGLNLSGAEVGSHVEVLHLEDEPREIFDRLLADGLAPGLRLAVVDRTHEGVTVEAAGRQWAIDSLAARNITIQYLPAGERAEGPRRTLRDVPLGEATTVAGISSLCQGPQRRRLLDLGIVRGTEMIPELSSAAGDPMAYRVRGALVALRRDQAAWVLVDDEEYGVGGAA